MTPKWRLKQAKNLLVKSLQRTCEASGYITDDYEGGQELVRQAQQALGEAIDYMDEWTKTRPK